ncbi:hypothetical protein G4B88_015610 [Cannabis sativa]|uniref:Uncharacterized protein n=1 Tax=Cannabis sativa TaxID=3483 RepID=A0A7J6H815_CANSA|nr:hypothetical protein G4B88_015610 [Cannabis sativa]
MSSITIIDLLDVSIRSLLRSVLSLTAVNSRVLKHNMTPIRTMICIKLSLPIPHFNSFTFFKNMIKVSAYENHYEKGCLFMT